MKRFLCSIIPAFLLFFAFPLASHAAELLIPGGDLIGLSLSDGSVTVAAFDDVLGQNARSSGLKIGDIILKIDGIPVTSTDDIRTALDHNRGDVELIVERGRKQHRITLSPVRTADDIRLGVYLRSGIAGIGTVTYYDPDTRTFGTLGHGVSDSGGELLCMTSGNAYTGEVSSIVKGKCGAPGQIRGTLVSQDPLAVLKRNTPCGVFGIMRAPLPGEPLPTAAYCDIATGPAIIRSTVTDKGVREYSVEIIKIYPQDRSDHRNFLLKVTDPALLNATGGIIQGMSGSPIIQNGKLIGAVTHVLVNDPTTGYGIFIENMLSAAG